jgi:hypothetical protein
MSNYKIQRSFGRWIISSKGKALLSCNDEVTAISVVEKAEEAGSTNVSHLRSSGRMLACSSQFPAKR